jgi:hypothetical protein
MGRQSQKRRGIVKIFRTLERPKSASSGNPSSLIMILLCNVLRQLIEVIGTVKPYRLELPVDDRNILAMHQTKTLRNAPDLSIVNAVGMHHAIHRC